MSFKENDKVRINAANVMNGEVGTVTLVYCDGQAFTVKFDDGRSSGFFLSELELVDEKREALITLAETLDSARQQANAIEETAPQRGVYGQIADSLQDTLELIFVQKVDDHSLFASLAYTSILDGNTVREALKAVVK